MDVLKMISNQKTADIIENEASDDSELNKYQIDLLIRTCAPREIVVCYDREEDERHYCGAYYLPYFKSSE